MITACDDIIGAIATVGYHNHRRDDHSAAMSRGILRDIQAMCEPFREDFASEKIRSYSAGSPAGRERKLDLVVAEPLPDRSRPNMNQLRLAGENKSVITAHRNRGERYDALSDVLGVLHRTRPDAILVATVLVGVCSRVLNIPDGVKKAATIRYGRGAFEERVLARLSTGDQELWNEFPESISTNSPADPQLTVDAFRRLPTRPPARTDLTAYDFVLLVPVAIDNVNPPAIARENSLGIDVDREYQAMLEQICRAYTARWHT
jgi:hypothetical protein